MSLLAQILVGLVALLHAWFLVLEMFLWSTPYGRRAFGHSAEQAEATRVLAANQGLYNGFLAAGLVWGLLAEKRSRAIKVFFLGCIVVAGIYGGVTAKMTILYVQALPALAALVLVLLAPPKYER